MSEESQITFLQLGVQKFGDIFFKMCELAERDRDTFDEMMPFLYKTLVFGRDAVVDPKTGVADAVVTTPASGLCTKALVSVANKNLARLEVVDYAAYALVSRYEDVNKVVDITTSLAKVFDTSCLESYKQYLDKIASRIQASNCYGGKQKTLNKDFVTAIVTFVEDIREFVSYEYGSSEYVKYLSRLVESVIPSQRGDFPDYGWGRHPLYPKNFNENFLVVELAMAYVQKIGIYDLFQCPIVVAELPSKFHTNTLYKLFEENGIFQESSSPGLPSHYPLVSKTRECVYVGSPMTIISGASEKMDRFRLKVDYIRRKIDQYRFVFIPLQLSHTHLEEQMTYVHKILGKSIYFRPYVFHRLDIVVTNFDRLTLLQQANQYLPLTLSNCRKCLIPNLMFSILRNHCAWESKLLHPDILEEYEMAPVRRTMLSNFVDLVGFQTSFVLPITGIIRNKMDSVRSVLGIQDIFRYMVESAGEVPNETNISDFKYDEETGELVELPTFFVSYYNLKVDSSFNHHIGNLLQLNLFKEERLGGKICYFLTPEGLTVYLGDSEFPPDYMKRFQLGNRHKVVSGRKVFETPVNTHLSEVSYLQCYCNRCVACIELVDALAHNRVVDKMKYTFLPKSVHDILRLHDGHAGNHHDLSLQLGEILNTYTRGFYFVPRSLKLDVICNMEPGRLNSQISSMENLKFQSYLLNTIVQYDPVNQVYALRE